MRRLHIDAQQRLCAAALTRFVAGVPSRLHSWSLRFLLSANWQVGEKALELSLDDGVALADSGWICTVLRRSFEQ
jgi:hypothetical protein